MYINSWLRFSNGICFKDVNETDISSVEEYIKNHALNDVTKQLEESFGGHCEFCLDDEQMIEIFGPRHASNPTEFRFELGDKALIRTLVSHVKQLVDGNGKLSGLARFEMPRKKTRNKPLLSNAKPRSYNKRTKSTTEKSIESLQSELFERVQSCLKSFGIDTSNFSNEMINVEPNKTYGNVQCILCSQDSEVKPKPKRVYYHSGLKSRYWVVENLKKHIHNVHQCFTTVSPQNRKPKKSPKKMGTPKKTKPPKIKQESVDHSTPKPISIVQINSDLDDSNVALSIIQSKLTSNASEPISVNDDDFDDEFDADFEADLSTNNNNPFSYLEQFSHQTTKMVEAVLTNGDTQSSMNFQLKNDKTVRQLSIVKIKQDGNCMFSSCAHQLFRHGIHSVEHKKKIAQLRAKVVAHILDPNHFSEYQFALQDRVYEMKKKVKFQT